MNVPPRSLSDATTSTAESVSALSPRSTQVVADPAQLAIFPDVTAPDDAPSAAGRAIERSRRGELDTSQIWEVQVRLEFLGMRPGSVDGIPGPQTTAAIRRYEESRGMPQTGKLDRQLLERLWQEKY
jgi:peptidoglycan hydrolase-like protein with peptidoglycan-binding domain